MRHNKASRADFLDFVFDSIAEVASRLPWQRVSAAEKERLGGHIFTRAADVVDDVVVALRLRPWLYPDLPGVADELEEGQRTAEGWLSLGLLLTHFGAV